MLFVFTYTAILLTLLFCSLAAFLFYRKPTSILAVWLGYLMLSDALWIGANAAADLSHTPSMLIFWSGMAFVGGCFFISFFLCFLDVFLTQKQPTKQHFAMYIGPSIFFSFFAFSKYAVGDTIFPPHAPAQISPGILYALFPLFLFASIIYGALRLGKHYMASKPQRKKQILYMEVGFLAVVFGGLIFNVALPLLGEIRFFTVGPQLSVIMFALTLYAIFRHKLLDIKIVIQLSIIYTAAFISIITVYFTFLFVLLVLFKNTTHTTIYLVNSLLTAIAGIWSVPMIEAYFRKQTDHIFFKDKYDYAQAVHEISETAGKYLTVKEIMSHTQKTIGDILKVRYIVYSLIPAYQGNAHHTLSFMTTAITLPLTVEGKEIGTIALGPKLSGDDFTDEDIRLVTTCTHPIALALEKARLYGQVLDYSKNLEEKVHERTREFKELQETQEQTIIDISHELQTPLTVIKGELDLLRTTGPKPTTLSVFEKSVDRISKFITALLKVSRLDAAGDDVKKEAIDMSHMLREQIEYFRVLCAADDITLSTSLEPHVAVLGHVDQLEEVVTNLMSNAMKYIANDKNISLTLRADGKEAILTITDTGIGIPKDMIPHLFERFYRGHKDHGAGIQGTGLGLAICERIIKNHGGTIVIDSVVGVGTTVTIRLPRLI